MEGKHVPGDKHLLKSLEDRQNELDYIDKIVDDIKSKKDDIQSIVVGMECNGREVYRTWQGSVNQCYGLAERLKLNLERSMWENNE